MDLRAYRRSGERPRRTAPAGGAARKRARRALCLEPLEGRALLSGVPELLDNVNPGTEGSSPELFTAVGGSVYFSADDGVTGRELWKTDGTAEGTVLVANITPGSANSNPGFITAANQRLGNVDIRRCIRPLPGGSESVADDVDRRSPV